MSYPHVYSPSKEEPVKKELSIEEKITKIFYRVGTIEKDLAALLHANGLQSSNKFLNQN